MTEKTFKVIGAMSGSSLDGIDLSLCHFKITSDGLSWELIKSDCVPFDESLQNKLTKGIFQSALDLEQLDVDFCKTLALAVQNFCNPDEYDILASHGHTLYHKPDKDMTIQIGNGGRLSSYLMHDVISDFRVQDVCLDGEGTPLVAIAERDLFDGYDYYLNLGGIANLSISNQDQWQAYDICPCNQVLNFLANKKGYAFDTDGKIAEQGSLNQGFLDQLLTEPYFSKTAPKSLDNNWIKSEWIPKVETSQLNVEDKMCTYVHLIAKTINDQIPEDAQNSKLLLSGGGGKNLFLVKILKELLEKKSVSLIIPEEEIINFKEAILMAYLGFLRMQESTNILSEVTGARSNVSAGALYLAPRK